LQTAPDAAVGMLQTKIAIPVYALRQMKIAFHSLLISFTGFFLLIYNDYKYLTYSREPGNLDSFSFPFPVISHWF
jgi:hypothetical protein